VDSQKIDNTISGGVALEAGYSEVNKKDDIYDGVFTDVQIDSLEKEGIEPTLFFSNVYTGLQGVVRKVENAISATIDWVIDTF